VAQPSHLQIGLAESQTVMQAAATAALGCGILQARLETGPLLVMGYQLLSTNLVVGVVGTIAMVVE
jgi:hypothetical protein